MQAAKAIEWVVPQVQKHEVYSLMFSTSLKHILEEGDELQKSFEQEENVFDRVNDLDVGAYRDVSQPSKILYYAMIVPHVFLNPANNYEFNTYSYSINSNVKPSSPDDTLVEFMYEFSPITMVIKKRSAETVGRFVVNVCVTIGGVFVIFGLLNRGVTWVVTSVLKG
jgi:hypothetical protein